MDFEKVSVLLIVESKRRRILAAPTAAKTGGLSALQGS